MLGRASPSRRLPAAMLSRACETNDPWPKGYLQLVSKQRDGSVVGRGGGHRTYTRDD